MTRRPTRVLPMTLRDLQLRLRALIAPRQVERELDEELAFHIECETRKLIERGLSPVEARRRALAGFGPVPLAADQCRDVRGTGLVDSTLRDILYGVRSFLRAPGAALTIVTTVALGLGLVAVVFTFFNAFFFRVDAVREPDELFTVQRLPRAGARVWIPFTRPEYEQLRAETEVFEETAAALRGVGGRIDGRMMNGTLVTGNFFQMLGVTAALGRTLTPADDQRGVAPAIVLSRRGWIRLFGEQSAAVGSHVSINGVSSQVVGVMPDGFRGLSLGAPDYWAPLALAAQYRRSYAGREDRVPIEVIGRLKAGVRRETAAAALGAWASRRTGVNADEARPPYFRLRPSRGTVGDNAGEAMTVFSPLFVAFGLILLIGCANAANLLLARGISRQREIGIRLAVGASRRRIVRQLLTESLLLALAASVLGFVLSRFLLDAALQLVMTTMPPEIAEQLNVSIPPADWRVVAFLLAGAFGATAVFGLAPALQATRLELVRAMRGEVTRDARPARAQNVLIAVQVTASALLLICAAVFLRGASVTARDPGFRTKDTVVVGVDNEPLRPAMLQAVTVHPIVASVAASSPHALSHAPSTFAEAQRTRTRIGLDYRFASAPYFDVLGIELSKGRMFSGAEQNVNAGVTLVSESAARALWPDGEVLGQILMTEALTEPGAQAPAARPRSLTVVGIVRDIRSPVRGDSAAVVYLPTSPEAPGTALTLRVHGDPEQARQMLTEHLTQIDPGLGTIMTMRTMAGLEAYILRLAFSVTVILGVLALVLTVSGLFSVLSYVVEQRTKEIGVRVAMGATARDVSRLVLSQSLRPVVGGLLAGVALAAGVATILMAFADPETATVVNALDPVAYAAGVTCIIAACVPAALIPASRAARIDPLVTLRQD